MCKGISCVGRDKPSSLNRQRRAGGNGGRQSRVKNYSEERSVATAFTTPLSQTAPWPHSGGKRWAANGAPQTSISHLFLTGHQMWRAEAGEGYMEGTIFAAAAVITSVPLLKRLSPLPVTKIATRKHTQWSREEGKQELPYKLQIHKSDS